MQLLFFVIAVIVTGIASLFNLCNGFIDPATFGSLGLSVLVFIAWALWSFVVVARSSKVKWVSVAMTVLYLVGILAVILYGKYEVLSSDLLGGIALAGGIFFLLPFAGFAKLLGGTVTNVYLGFIPYIVLIVLVWVFAYGVMKSGIADRHVAKVNAKNVARIEKKAAKKAEKSVKTDSIAEDVEKVLTESEKQ